MLIKVVLFGGSFGPPRKEHDATTKKALAKFDVDKLVTMFASISPFKEGFFADERQRFARVDKLWKNSERIEICDLEIKQKRPVSSVESVEYLYKTYRLSRFYLLTSVDHLEKLHPWYDFGRLNSLVEFIIANRNDIETPRDFKDLRTNMKIAPSFIRSILDTHEIYDKIRDEVKNYYERL